MTFIQTQTDRQREQERQQQQEQQKQITRSRLVEKLLQPTPDLPQFLNDLVHVQAVIVAGTEAAAFILQPGKEQSELSLNNVAHIRPDTSDDTVKQQALQAFSELIGMCIQDGRDGAIEVAPTDGTREAQYCLITLLRADGRIVAVTAVITRCLDDQRSRQRLESMQLIAGYFDVFLMRKSAESMKLAAQNHQDVLQYAGAMSTSDGFKQSVANVCNELSTRTGASRVSLGWCHGWKVKVEGLSHTENFDKKQELTVQIARAMEECADQDEIVQFDPGDGIIPGQSTANNVREALALSKLEGGTRVTSIPLRRKGEVVGVITLEFPQTKKPTDHETTGLAVASEVLGPQLFDRWQNDRWLPVKALYSVHNTLKWAKSPVHTLYKLLIILLVVLLLFITFYSPMHYVKAPFSFVADTRRTISAPIDGLRVSSVLVEPGQRVEEGQVLLQFDSEQLKTQKFTADKKAQAKRVEARNLAGNTDRNQLAESRQAVLEAEQAELEARNLQMQIDKTIVKAPISGYLGAEGMKKKLNNTLKLGDPLFEITQPESLRVEIKVDERDIQRVNRRFSQGETVSGLIRTRARPDVEHKFVIDRIVPSAEAVDQKNKFIVYARVEDPEGEWRPGQEGEAAIESENRALIWQWTYRLWDYARLKLWI